MKLALFVFVELHSDLGSATLVFGELHFDSLALTFEGLPKLPFFAFAAGMEPFLGHLRRLLGTFFKLWPTTLQLFDIKNGRVLPVSSSRR